MIKICRKSSNEAQQGPIPDEHEYGQALWEESPGSAISGRVDDR
jgi:hypothetical protein